MSRSRIQVVVELKDQPATSRASSTGRSRVREVSSGFVSTTLGSNSKISKRQTRGSASSTVSSSNVDEDLVDNFPHPSQIGLVVQQKGKLKPTISRTSMSSISTANDYGTSSGYTTPATSAVATPAVVPKQDIESSLPRPRGRPRATLTTELPAATLSAFQLAKNMRSSEFSLVPASNKRKRYCSDEDEDDSDDTPDAKLAKSLQDDEFAMAKMFGDDESDVVTTKRTRRALRSIRPKSDYAEDFSDDGFDINLNSSKGKSSSATSVSKAKLPAAQSAKRFKLTPTDSEVSDFVISDSDDDLSIRADDMRSSGSNVPATWKSTTGRKKAARTREAAPGMKTQASYEKNKASSTDRGSTRGGYHLPAGGMRTKGGRALLVTDDPADTDLTLASTPNTLSDLSDSDSDDIDGGSGIALPRAMHYTELRAKRRAEQDRHRLETHHPELLTMWDDLKNLPAIKTVRAEQPTNITRQLKPFQLEGLTWMKAMEKTEWGGGLLGDEMGMGKTIQAVSLIMSDYPAKNPSLVLIPPVALMQWQQEIGDYTDGTLKTFVFHGTNKFTKGISVKDLKQYDVILMSYNSLESMYRHQEKGRKRKEAMHFEKSVMHQIHFHRVILDEAHNIKTRTTGVAKACFALKADHKWCLSGTPLQNRIGEFFSLVRFLDIQPFACYFCKQCPCKPLEWTMNSENRCTGCSHSGMQHVSVFNQELLNPIQKYGNSGLGKKAFEKLRILTDRFMLRRVKRDHSSAMELPAKEIQVDRQFFGEEENDFAASIMNNGTRKFETYVAQGVLLNNYANIFGLIMQMRQVADHPDLILKKNGEGGQNVLVCCICDEPAEEAIRSTCRHDFCRSCVRNYLKSSDESNIQPDCPQCHIPLSIDLEQPELEQDQQLVKKSSIINRIKMENWTSSSKIEALVHDLHSLRSYKSSTKSIIFSQFTTMLQLVEWRLRRAGITTVMLDGSMTPAQRQASINHFMNDVNVECFLVSLKAGGVALNLTEASKVFIVDPWWNPAAEWQSADRCHRIGQCRPCSITRLCIEDSVESRMVLLQEKKANMINSTINADDSAMESLTAEDMQFLFRGN